MNDIINGFMSYIKLNHFLREPVLNLKTHTIQLWRVKEKKGTHCNMPVFGGRNF